MEPEVNESIGEQGAQPVGNQQPVNAESKDWFEKRRELGTEAHEAETETKENSPEERKEKTGLTDLDKANYSWSKKLMKSKEKLRATQEVYEKSESDRRVLAERLQAIEEQLKQVNGYKPKDLSTDNNQERFVSENIQKALAQSRLTEEQQRLKAEATYTEQREKQALWTGRSNEVKAILPDWEDVVRSGGAEIKLSNDVLTDITESDLGHEIAYYLAKNPEEATRLNTLSDRARTQFLSRIEAKIELGALEQYMPKKPIASKPTAMASGNSSGQAKTAMSFEEYAKIRKAGKHIY